jgi:hypothetical protein
LSLRILDLPSASNFTLSISRTVGDGGCFVNNIAPLGSGVQSEVNNLIEGFEAGWRISYAKVGPKGLENSLYDALECEKHPLGKIASDESLDGSVAILELNWGLSERFYEDFFNDLNRFWNKRGELGPALIILCPFDWHYQFNKKVPFFSWNDVGFHRIDRMIWALTHLSQIGGPLEIFAELLAVEFGGQDLGLIARIASADKDDLENPKVFLERIFSKNLDDVSEKKVWRAQVQSFLPWIEEARQGFIKRYKRHLFIDEHQVKLRVQDINDIEIGGVSYQLLRAGCLTAQENDLLRALSKIRSAVAHGKLCAPRDLSVAVSKADQI